MKKILIFTSTLFICLLARFSYGQMIANISENVVTGFGVYHPVAVSFNPSVEFYSVEPDFSNVENFPRFKSHFNDTELQLLQNNHFVVKYGQHKQLYDLYNEASFDATPIFVTSDAVLHIYHVLYDKLLTDAETNELFQSASDLTATLIGQTSDLLGQTSQPQVREAAWSNLAFLYVAAELLNPGHQVVPDTVKSLVNQELSLIEDHKGFSYSPVFGSFSALDYSQFVPRGHYTRSELLKKYFKAMMWYGWTIFTMEPDKFGELSKRHTLQALLLTQMIYQSDDNYDRWARIYEPTTFFVGRADDPMIQDYYTIARDIYGSNFLNLSAEVIADDTLLNAFISEAQKLPEPAIPNWVYGSYTTYKGFRLMGQRNIPDSYMFAHLIDPFVGSRFMPKGLDIMAILGSDCAFNIADSVYKQTEYPNYSNAISDFRNEFAAKPPEEWAQNLYWNWLYCLMPLLYEKEAGFPVFMQNTAWSRKELNAALASWAELRHDTILYAKQSMSPCCIPPGPPRSYVEPNPNLYARLQGLVHFTRDGLSRFGLLKDDYREKLELFESLLNFLTRISVKELENIPLTTADYENIFCFGKVMEELVSSPDTQPGDEPDIDDMAVIADVHTDSNSNMCLEEGVGYPLEIFVIVKNDGYMRMTHGAVFSYYEFTQPIADRLTDEKWQEMLLSNNAPDLPVWTGKYMDGSLEPGEYFSGNPDNIFDKNFTGLTSEKTETIPQTHELVQNYPNPFNPSTTIRYQLKNPGYTRLTIYDITGTLVNVLVNGDHNAGSFQIAWDGKDSAGKAVASGIYFYQLKTASYSVTKRMVLLR